MASERLLAIKEKYDRFVNLHSIKRLEDVVVERAEGAKIYDVEGREYIDCFAGISVVNAGHGNARVLEAAKKQMDKLVHCGAYVYYSEPPALFAEKLAEVTPGALSKTFFSNSGAEAIEGALRIAKEHTGNPEVIALTASFHGRTNATLSVTGNRKRKYRGGPYLSGVAFAPAPYCYRCPFEMHPDSCGLKCARFLRDIFDFHTSGSVGAFIAEPVMGEGGIIMPPPGYFETVKEILDELGILFIADEVQSGFGRTGHLFAIQGWNAVPDIITMAKGIAGGFPLSAFITTPEIASAFRPGDHLSTFGGNPVSCAAALANVEFLVGENVPGQAMEKGKYFMEQCGYLAKKYPLSGDIRGRGLMIGLELVHAEKRPAAAETAALREFCRKEGVLIGHGGVNDNVVRFQPPLVISREEMDRALDALDKGLASLEK